MTNPCIPAAIGYHALGWWVVPVHGFGCVKPKKPIPTAWQTDRNPIDAVIEMLKRRPHAGIAVHLGGSGLIDLEGDSPAAEATLDYLCQGCRFPFWRSKRGKHRLFRNDREIEHAFFQMEQIEFRAGNHVSILPPSLHADGELRYSWEIHPSCVEPPPLPERAYLYYLDQKAKAGPRSPASAAKAGGSSAGKGFVYRDSLDYVLRHFDLMAEAKAAGLEFTSVPNLRGDAYCFVPAALRGGNGDEQPSGVFNIGNGVLRDFATGINYRFLDLVGTLTSRHWKDVLADFEAKAGVKATRAHSRRISLPGPKDAAQGVSIDEAREQLTAYLREQLDREATPGKVHVILGRPGVGKTTAMCHLLAELKKKAIILTLENRLARVHAKMLLEKGADARRMPILRETPCPHPDEYEAMSRLGYKPSKSLPCGKCAIGARKCQYLISFNDLTSAAQLCCAAVYHTHDNFYQAYGNQDRPIAIFDENCIDLLLAPVCHSLASWAKWARVVKKRHQAVAQDHTARLLALTDWLAAMAEELLNSGDKNHYFRVPGKLKSEALSIDNDLNKWLHSQASKQLPNLYSLALYLLNEPESYVLLEAAGKGGVRVRFRKVNPLPKDKEVFILDATASPEIVRAVAPGWDVRVWNCPQIDQRGNVVQIMDYDASRIFIKKEVSRSLPHSPSWTVQVIDAILEKHGSVALVTFKKVQDAVLGFDLLAKLKHQDRITDIHHYPCRGINVQSDVLIVLGTPYKNQTTVLELALAMYGLDDVPVGDYRRRERLEDCFRAANMGYDDPRLDGIERFLVGSDLAQAVGRVRPLQNDVTVYVLSNYQVPDWEVEQVSASELFDLRTTTRMDFAENYDRYASELLERLENGEKVGNPEICRALGIEPRSGRNYMTRFREQYHDQLSLKGRKMMLRKRPTTTKESHL